MKIFNILKICCNNLQAVENLKGTKSQQAATMNENCPVIDEKSLYSIQNALTTIFKEAIGKAFPELTQAPVIIAPSSHAKFGDYQCNSAMPIMQMLKAQGDAIFNFLNVMNVIFHS